MLTLYYTKVRERKKVKYKKYFRKFLQKKIVRFHLFNIN